MGEFNDILIDFLNDSYDELIKKNNYTIHELEIIRKYLDDLIDSIRDKER